MWSINTHVFGHFSIHAAKSKQYSEMHSRHYVGTSQFDVTDTVVTISILSVHLESQRENTELPLFSFNI